MRFRILESWPEIKAEKFESQPFDVEEQPKRYERLGDKVWGFKGFKSFNSSCLGASQSGVRASQNIRKQSAGASKPARET